MTTAERHALAANLVRSGRSVAEAARELGVTPKTVRSACRRFDVLPKAVQRPDADWAYGVPTLDAPEWAGLCWYRRCTTHPCREVATWQTVTSLGVEVMACDAHREAMQCRVRVRVRQVAS